MTCRKSNCLRKLAVNLLCNVNLPCAPLITICDMSQRDFARWSALHTDWPYKPSTWGPLGLQAKVNVRMDWCTALVPKISNSIRVK